MLRWAPYGGPRDEDTLPQFGMTCERLFERFRAIVRESARAVGDAADHALIDRAVKLLNDLEGQVCPAPAPAGPAPALPERPAPAGHPPRGSGWRMVRGVWRRA